LSTNQTSPHHFNSIFSFLDDEDDMQNWAKDMKLPKQQSNQAGRRLKSTNKFVRDLENSEEEDSANDNGDRSYVVVKDPKFVEPDDDYVDLNEPNSNEVVR